ncbi:MAG: MTAP family purine nucleoside phosphorylase [Solirubrobacterales bacterium]
MPELAVVGGHSVLGVDYPWPSERRKVETEHGSVVVAEAEAVVGLQRHGYRTYTAAPAVNHAANLAALAELGCKRVLAIGSSGGLREELAVGTFVCPDDFIALHLGISISDGHGGEGVPGFDPQWRATVLATWSGASDVPIRDGGVYWQTIGPRFETPAEIRLLAAHADLVGMTIASESIIAHELGLSYAAVCVVDNLANGVAAEPLTMEQFEAGKLDNRERLLSSLAAVVPALAEMPA